MKNLLVLVFLLTTVIGWNQSSVYGVDPFSSNLSVIDTTTFIETTTVLTSSTGIVTGCNGLASDPCGVNYIVYKVGGSRYLGTVNFSTSVITEIGLLADNISSIAYDYSNSLLYGVTGDGANTPETLYESNTTTASMTFVQTLGNGNDGEAITYNPTDGLLYHWSGWGVGNVIMETIDPLTFVITPITLSGGVIENVGSAVYAGGKFLVSDINLGEMHWVTTSGSVTNTAASFDLKGLSFGAQGTSTITLSSSPGSTVCPGSSVVITPSTLNSNATYNWLNGAGVSIGVTTSTVSTDTAGTFTCEVTGPCGIVTSSPITITAGSNPVVQLSPAGPIGICPGDDVLISSNTSGINQWYVNGQLLPGQNNDSLTVSTEGIYNMILENTDGCSDSSSVGVLVVFNSVPNVILSPAGPVEFCPGDSVEITVNTGGGAIQWTKDGVVIPNAATNSFYASMSGSYNVIKTNMSGCSDSSATPVQVTEATLPSVILTPSPEAIFCGPGTVDLSVNNGGGARQWYVNGSLISGETGMTYSVSAEGIYNVLKTNMSGCSDSAAVGITAIDTCLLSISGHSNELNFNVFPNPASHQFTIDFDPNLLPEVLAISIIGMDGKVVLTVPKEAILSNSLLIDSKSLSSGYYIVSVVSKRSESHKELIIN